MCWKLLQIVVDGQHRNLVEFWFLYWFLFFPRVSQRCETYWTQRYGSWSSCVTKKTLSSRIFLPEAERRGRTGSMHKFNREYPQTNVVWVWRHNCCLVFWSPSLSSCSASFPPSSFPFPLQNTDYKLSAHPGSAATLLSLFLLYGRVTISMNQSRSHRTFFVILFFS